MPCKTSHSFQSSRNGFDPKVVIFGPAFLRIRYFQMDRSRMSPLLKLVWFLLFAQGNFDHVSSENIVVWQVLGTTSTRISMTPLMEELAEKGHDVTLISVFPNMDNTTTKYKTVVPKKWLEQCGTSWDEGMRFFDLRKNPSNVPKLWYDFLNLGLWGCQMIYEDEEFVSWAKGTKVDLVIIESVANDCAYGLSYYWKAKIIMYGTSTVTPFMPDAYGLPDETSSVTDVIFGFPSSKNNPMPLWQRILNALNPIVYHLWRNWKYLPAMEAMTRNALGLKEDELRGFVDIEKNTSLILLTSHYSFSAIRSFPPNVIAVGGAVVSKKPRPLPKDMEKFINEGKNGFMFVSFGTVAEFANFDDEVQIEFISALEQFPDMRFVWKSNKAINHTVPNNVFVTKWAPQQTILGHPKIKGFISHMGMGSTAESISFGVPMICLPVICDQDMNADVISDRGAGIKLEILTLKREELYWAIKEILGNPKYRENMKRLSSIYKDRPRPPLEEAMWWISYVLRHDNIHEIMMPPSAHQSWWKRRNLDVWFSVYTLMLLVSILPLYLIQLIAKKVVWGNSTKKLKTS